MIVLVGVYSPVEKEQKAMGLGSRRAWDVHAMHGSGRESEGRLHAGLFMFIASDIDYSHE
ncbi:uncharacterized protein EAF01_001531 [Botrytis porri]|uniref:uncharacterized protein n=1 Tax=Botrytis porri TaxID=87229 RepID=UPI0019006E76|nr:uncharacterized protein EAF01_001531 [Botrytis porri]KAF7912510.1 hypothetical protein EAF01_001531 [Botrytis porri]